MQFDVYRLIDGGGLMDPVEVLKIGPARGELVLSKRRGDSTLMAQLMKPDGSYVLPVMIYAQVIKIDEKGMLIEGTQVIQRGDSLKARSTSARQRWLCKFPGQPAVLAPRTKPHRRDLARDAAAQRSGFDPRDDDRDVEELSRGEV